MTTEVSQIPDAFVKQVHELLTKQLAMQKELEPEAFLGIISCGLLSQPADVVKAAVPLMAHYKSTDLTRLLDRYKEGEFDPEKPAFCQLWGFSKHFAEVLAYYGPTTVGYLLLIPRGTFRTDYEVD